jgi:5-methylthioadenosine/S-adenosylhomocysteine deaminase
VIRRVLVFATLASAAALAVAGFGCRQPIPGGREVSLIVSNAIVVTMDEGKRILNPGSIAIDGTSIVAIDRPDVIASKFRGTDQIDATGRVVMPGLINTHTHAPMVLYRGLADDLALMDWLQKYIFPAEAKTVSPEFVRVGTRLAALEMIRSGTTTYADMYYFEEEIARETKAAGLRGVLGQTIIQFPVADAKTPGDALVRAETFLQQFAKDDLITPAVAPHSMYTLDAQTLIAVKALATKYTAPVLIHLAETADEIKISTERHQMRPVAFLEGIGFWDGPFDSPDRDRSSLRAGPPIVAAHGVWLQPDEIAILKEHNIGVSHNPESNMKLASGAAPVPGYLAAGVALGLGTDGAASNNDLDMFEAMRQAAFLHKFVTRDPTVVSAGTALEMATIGGARVLGMADKIGSLEVGKRADLIVVRMDSARQTPMYDPVSHLVYATRGDDVEATVVNGRVLMRGRSVLTLNETDVLREANLAAEQVRKAVQ